MIVKLAFVCGVLLIVFVAPVAACGGDGDFASPGPVAPSTRAPSEVLTAAVRALENKNLRYTIPAPGSDLDCSYNATSKGTLIKIKVDNDPIEHIVLGNDLYVGGLDPADRHVHMTGSKIPDGSPYLQLMDPLSGVVFLEAASDIKQETLGGFSGTIDIRKVRASTSPYAKRIADAMVKNAGHRAGGVSFTATVDAQGRLGGVKMTFPGATAADAFAYEVKIVEIGGAAVTVEAPPRARVVDATTEQYNA